MALGTAMREASEAEHARAALRMPLKAPADPEDASCSHPRMIAALKVGESHAAVRRLSQDNTSRQDIAAATESLRNTINKAQDRARKKTGGYYVVEIGDYRTRSYDLIVAATVTRLR